MRLLMDVHPFRYTAQVPWPIVDSQQTDWILGVHLIENWLNTHVGDRLSTWAWNDSGSSYQLGVGFRWEKDKTLFVLKWSTS